MAFNWIYIGLSQPMPLYSLVDGKTHPSRSFSHAYGSHSVQYFAAYGVDIKWVPQESKHRCLTFLDPTRRDRLRVPVLPYPKRDASDADI